MILLRVILLHIFTFQNVNMTDKEPTEECIGLGAALESFKESREIVEIINNLSSTLEDNNQHELAVERFRYVLDWYQEQPHLLDPFLEEFLRLMIENIKLDTESRLLHATTQLMTHLFKVRGPKVLLKYLSHEVVWRPS